MVGTSPNPLKPFTYARFDLKRYSGEKIPAFADDLSAFAEHHFSFSNCYY